MLSESRYISSESCNEKSCREIQCVQCLVAGHEACDAPVINKLINTVYITFPYFPFYDNGTLININSCNEYCFNYYISLPYELYTEIRLLWPIVWIIPKLVQELQGKFSGSGNIIVKFSLNVLSKKLIKAPSQANSILTTDNIVNDKYVCDSTAIVYDYTFNFAFVNGSPSSILSTTSPSFLTFSEPNNSIIAKFVIDPNTLKLISQNSVNLLNIVVSTLISYFDYDNVNNSYSFYSNYGYAYDAVLTALGATSAQIAEFNTFYNNALIINTVANITIAGATITFTASGTFSGTFVFTSPDIIIASPAQYISFVLSYNNNKNDYKNYWVATNLESYKV